LTIASHGAFTFKSHQNDGSRSHECDQLAEERTRLVLRIKLFTLSFFQADQLHCGNFESIFFEHLNDRTDRVLFDRVRLNDAESGFHGHDFSQVCFPSVFSKMWPFVNCFSVCLRSVSTSRNWLAARSV